MCKNGRKSIKGVKNVQVNSIFLLGFLLVFVGLILFLATVRKAKKIGYSSKDFGSEVLEWSVGIFAHALGSRTPSIRDGRPKFFLPIAIIIFGLFMMLKSR
jgi:uncharacterized membrane protein